MRARLPGLYAEDAPDGCWVPQDGGTPAPRGPAGSMHFFDADTAHGSAPNMSLFDRALCQITYDSIHNTPSPRENPRPEFHCSRDFTPIVPLVEAPQPA